MLQFKLFPRTQAAFSNSCMGRVQDQIWKEKVIPKNLSTYIISKFAI